MSDSSIGDVKGDDDESVGSSGACDIVRGRKQIGGDGCGSRERNAEDARHAAGAALLVVVALALSPTGAGDDDALDATMAALSVV